MASLYFKYSAMNSGKTTQLLQVHYNYTERGMNPLAITAKIDNRAGVGLIKARIGLELKAEIFYKKSNIYNLFQSLNSQKKIDAVLIDEAQFMSRQQVLQCANIVDEFNIPVMCYGLKADFKANLFEGSEALLCYADNIEEIKTICWCGKKAIHNARIDANGDMITEGEQILIGGNESYISLCRKHFLRGQAKPVLKE